MIAFGPILGVLIILGPIFIIAVSIASWREISMQHIKKIYLYLVSFAALIIAIIGAIMLINMALKAWVFTKADQDYYPIEYYSCKANQPKVEGDKSVPVTATEANCTPEELDKLKKERDDRRTGQKQRDAAQAIAMVLVATPVWFMHWRWARKEV